MSFCSQGAYESPNVLSEEMKYTTQKSVVTFLTMSSYCIGKNSVICLCIYIVGVTISSSMMDLRSKERATPPEMESATSFLKRSHSGSVKMKNVVIVRLYVE